MDTQTKQGPELSGPAFTVGDSRGYQSGYAVQIVAVPVKAMESLSKTDPLMFVLPRPWFSFSCIIVDRRRANAPALRSDSGHSQLISAQLEAEQLAIRLAIPVEPVTPEVRAIDNEMRRVWLKIFEPVYLKSPARVPDHANPVVEELPKPVPEMDYVASREEMEQKHTAFVPLHHHTTIGLDEFKEPPAPGLPCNPKAIDELTRAAKKLPSLIEQRLAEIVKRFGVDPIATGEPSNANYASAKTFEREIAKPNGADFIVVDDPHQTPPTEGEADAPTIVKGVE